MVMPREIVEDVSNVLRSAACGKGNRQPGFLSAIQILERLPTALKARLIEEHGPPGRESGSHSTATHVVEKSLRMLVNAGQAHKEGMDSRGLQFQIDGEWVEPGYGLCALYQWIGER
jgi:hypothetical protein